MAGSLFLCEKMFTMKKTIGIVIATGLLLLSGCAGPTPTRTPAPTTPLRVEVTKNLAYIKPLQSSVAPQKLDVYSPTEPGPWPVVVVLHGYGETEVGRAARGEAIAEQGAVVFTPSWTVTTPTSAAMKDGEGFRELFEDLTCAVRFARAKASNYGGDPTRVTVVGFSAGACIGSTVALARDDLDRLWEEFASIRGGPPPQADCLVSGVSALPNAFVGLGGCYGFADFLKEEDPELWEVVSPYALIGGNPNVRVRLIHGERDGMCPVENAVEFHKTLENAGYDATLTTVDAAHGIPPTSPVAELMIQLVMEVARD